jgi:hypothetical protein
LGYKAAGEALSADDADYGLQALNASSTAGTRKPVDCPGR